MDHKMLAAGDREGNQQQQEHLENYAKGALAHLLTFTRAEMSEDEQKLWEARLSKVPLWKLKRLDEFTSPYINSVWEFFDGLRMLPPRYETPALPEPKSSIGKDTIAHVKRVIEFMGDFKPSVTFKRYPEKYAEEYQAWLTEKRKIERKGLKELNAKYPWAGFDKVLREKRFQEML